MKSFQFTCDMCGKIKGQNNHWFSLSARPASGSEGLADADHTELLIEHFNAEVESRFVEAMGFESGEAYACGNACLAKFVERWTKTDSLEPSRKAAGDPA